MAETQNPKEPDSLEVLSAELHAHLVSKFGSNWRKELKVPLRVDLLWWVFRLAVEGLQQRRQKLRETPYKDREAADIATVVSLECDLQNFLNKITSAR